MHLVEVFTIVKTELSYAVASLFMNASMTQEKDLSLDSGKGLLQSYGGV